jgi:hypothetical protein
MPRKFIDLSIFLENEVVSDPQPFTPRITDIDHQARCSQGRGAPLRVDLRRETR